MFYLDFLISPHLIKCLCLNSLPWIRKALSPAVTAIGPNNQTQQAANKLGKCRFFAQGNCKFGDL